MTTAVSASSGASDNAAELDTREELRRILRDTAILYSTGAQPVRHRNGEVAPWAFYSWNATLTSFGLRLAAQNLLERLRSYSSTQLISYGYTATPLLAACVLLGEGRYTGAVIRERRKQYLSCRRIEGLFDKTRPVIVIDDSLSSGTSLQKAITAVEDEGGEVEGALALVHFPFRGGCEWANSLGYRVETLFNIWTDLEMSKTIDPPDSYYPPRTAFGRLPDGLAPAVLARQVAQLYLQSGCVPSPPLTLDRSYNARGGTFVSFRRKSDDLRLHRDGFWHFPPDSGDPCEDVVSATVTTIRNSLGIVHAGNLDDLKIAVTFLGPLELVSPRKLDFDQYGIVVRSRVLPNKVGGALPNTQVFISETEQYRHARSVNAGVDALEPHDLFRHTLVKCVEPGEDWLPYGCPDEVGTSWWGSLHIGECLTSHARGLVRACASGGAQQATALPQSLIPARIHGIAVKLYDRGVMVGYGISLGSQIDECVSEAVRHATSEKRFAAALESGLDIDALAITVSVLHHPEALGAAPVAEVAKKLRRGLDALAVTSNGRTNIILPTALVYNNWERSQFVQAALDRAGGYHQKCCWTTYQTAEWVSSSRGVFPLRFGFPHRHPASYTFDQAERDIRLLGSYILSVIGSDGIPCYYLNPITGERQHAGTSARSLHALLTLDSAGQYLAERKWSATAAHGYRYCLSHLHDGTLELPDRNGGELADAVLLAGLARSETDLVFSNPARQLASRLAGLFRRDGRISTVQKRLNMRDDQDYLPGAVLWAVGEYCRVTGAPVPVTGAHLDFYRHRFRAVPNWGMAGWQPQGWGAVHRLTHNAAQAELAFQCADWAIDRQLEKNGAFLEDLCPDEPSFDTGFIAEGLAAAWSIALERGDEERAARYRGSWLDAMRFMRTLMIDREDTFGMYAGDLAVGGVRCMLSRSDIRIDQVSHCLSALVAGAQLMRRGLI